MFFPNTQNSAASITLVEGKVRRRISLSDILFIQSEHIYMRIFLRDGQKILHRGALRDLIQQLPNRSFLQIHRSYIINLQWVNMYSNGIAQVAGQEIPVSRTYRKIMREALSKALHVSVQNKNRSVQNRAI